MKLERIVAFSLMLLVAAVLYTTGTTIADSTKKLIKVRQDILALKSK